MQAIIHSQNLGYYIIFSMGVQNRIPYLNIRILKNVNLVEFKYSILLIHSCAFFLFLCYYKYKLQVQQTIFVNPLNWLWNFFDLGLLEDYVATEARLSKT